MNSESPDTVNSKRQVRFEKPDHQLRVHTSAAPSDDVKRPVSPLAFSSAIPGGLLEFFQTKTGAATRVLLRSGDSSVERRRISLDPNYLTADDKHFSLWERMKRVKSAKKKHAHFAEDEWHSSENIAIRVNHIKESDAEDASSSYGADGSDDDNFTTARKLSRSWNAGSYTDLTNRRNTASNEASRNSSSDLGRYLLLRRSIDPQGSSELLGSFEDDAIQAYRQLLSNLQCYNLMPLFGRLVIIDSKLPVKQAFTALVENQVRASVMFGNKDSTVEGVLTYRDLIVLLLQLETCSEQATLKFLNMPLDESLARFRDNDSPKDYFSPKFLKVVTIEDSLYKASKIMCQRKIHRLIVFDDYSTSNPLFLLSKKMVLQSMKKYIDFLPFPSTMFLSLEELRIGTWSDFVCVTRRTNLHVVAELFANRHFSTIPVLNDDNSTVYSVITKASIINLVVEHYTTNESSSGAKTFQLKERTVADALVHNPAPISTASPKTTIYSAIDRLVQSESHVLVIVDGKGHLKALVAVIDFLKFLLQDFQS